MRNLSYYQSVFGVMLLSYVISGCATPPTHNPDPFENFNRGVFAFNEGVDQIVVKPVAETYKGIVPDPVDRGVTNFFSNLDDIVVIANDLLQFKFKQAASDSGRFFINSTVGLLGFIDVGTELGLSKHNEDFGQTLGHYGIGSGFHIVLPFFGPSNVRDTIGITVDGYLSPLVNVRGLEYYKIPDNLGQSIAIVTLHFINKNSLHLGEYESLKKDAIDLYPFLRDIYEQKRISDIAE